MQPDGKSEVLHYGEDEPTLAQMQQAVGGLIEYAPVMRGSRMPLPAHICGGQPVEADVLDVIVNEEGLLMGLEANPIAALAAQGANGLLNMLAGPAILVFLAPDTSQPVRALDRDDFLLRTAPEDAENLMDVNGMMPSLALEPQRRNEE